MKLITEMYDDYQIILRKGKNMKIKEFYARMNKNRNGRIYPLGVLEKEVKSIIKN